ncbi:MAG: RHS repeat-associated core domain-containing protein, partial [Acidobacteria bacterium]|nr:RHS repeat-associated core domain-containing protein [Acidobacteriota bacterium]
SLAYDANDRLVESNGLTMTRDLNGRIDVLTLAPGKTVTYSYDARGLLSQVTDWVGGAPGITTFTYDDASRLTTITRPNGVDTTLGYDADSRVVSMTEGALSSSVLTYDAAGKLIRADRTVPTAGDASGATPTAHTYDDASQVVGYTYDALGRLTDDGVRTYVWDLASRLTSVTRSPNTVSYTYDALGNRLTRTEAAATRCYVWNYALGLPSVNVERTGGACGSDLRYYVTTPGGLLLYSREAADDSRRDYHYDQIGNTLFLTDAAGVVVASYAYDPYGELLASAGAVENLFTWQGRFGVMREKGATGATDGLYYLRARYYDSGTRRFLSRDLVPTLDPTTVNPYQYAAGAPTRFVDPLGLQQDEPEDAAIPELRLPGSKSDPRPVPKNVFPCGPANQREANKKALSEISGTTVDSANETASVGEETSFRFEGKNMFPETARSSGAAASGEIELSTDFPSQFLFDLGRTGRRRSDPPLFFLQGNGRWHARRLRRCDR